MIEKLTNLIDVKSITTLLLVLVFSYLAIIGVIQPDQFMTVFSVIIAFYFGTQHQKQTEAINKANTTE